MGAAHSLRACCGSRWSNTGLPDLQLTEAAACGRKTTLVSLEHLNVNVPSWSSANDVFWCKALGFAKDQRADAVCKNAQMTGGTMKGLMWINAGLQQCHMPLGEAPPDDSQSPSGMLGVAYEDVAALKASLQSCSVPFTDLQGQMQIGSLEPAALELKSPTGVRVHVHSIKKRAWLTPRGWMDCESATAEGVGLPSDRPSICMGIPYIRLHCLAGTAAGLCRFYDAVFSTTAELRQGRHGNECWVPIGKEQWLIYEEVKPGESVPYDGYHVAIYINSFVEAYRQARALGVVWNNPRFPHLTYDTEEDSIRHNEFRVLQVLDPKDGTELIKMEHEVRSLAHPGFCARAWI
eukprot:TRINITY_DN64181_c0_g1_i1.p1 TRINITY_DN64181_c0_g1~~TRINITY_DN64181_c0_g1_i1.p1  ORF type:complete len:362 (+),score=49.79 TRINITY_DN64181_c0_g1_i1:42-1088(+)